MLVRQSINMQANLCQVFRCQLVVDTLASFLNFELKLDYLVIKLGSKLIDSAMGINLIGLDFVLNFTNLGFKSDTNIFGVILKFVLAVYCRIEFVFKFLEVI